MADRRWPVAVAGALALSAAYGQEAGGPDRLFLDDHVLDVQIVAPIESLVKERSTEDYVAGKLSYSDDGGDLVELDIGVRTRGRFRRKPETCQFPPLRLNFKKSQVKGTLFAKQNKLKLVTHCKTGSYVLEQAVLSEYLAYRILNVLTDKSFNARLARVRYSDTLSGETFEGLGILIEHKNRLGKRLGRPPVSIEKTSVSSLDPDHLNLTSVFQYLIGNTDFSPIAGAPGTECCHNYTLFGEEAGPYYSIPYDFDMSGLVSAPYANPNPKLRLDSVRERLYRGRCVNNELLPNTFEQFHAARESIEELIRSQPELSRRTRDDALRYVKGFYKTISKPKSVERHFIRKCE